MNVITEMIDKHTEMLLETGALKEGCPIGFRDGYGNGYIDGLASVTDRRVRVRCQFNRVESNIHNLNQGKKGYFEGYHDGYAKGYIDGTHRKSV